MSSYYNSKYDLNIKSLYDVFSTFTKEEVDITLATFKKSFLSLNLLRKKYGNKYDGTGVSPLIKLSLLDESSLKNFLSRIDTRLKCISYLLKDGKNKEHIISLFDNKDDNEINIMVKMIIEKYEGAPKQEDTIYENLEQILDAFKTDELTLLEALNELEDEDKKLSYIYTYGISCLPLTKKEILKKLSITKPRYEKYIKEVQKLIPRLIEKSKNKKAFKLKKLQEKEAERKKELTTQESEKIELKEIKGPEIVSESNEFIKEVPVKQDVEFIEINGPEIVSETKEETNNEIPEVIEQQDVITPVVEIIQEEQTTTTPVDTTPVVEIIQEEQTEEIKEQVIESKTETKVESDYDTMLIQLYVEEIGIDEIESSTLPQFEKAVLTIAYYDLNKQSRIINLYINYLQERYKNNLNNLEILNKLVMIINKFGHSFDVTDYENIFRQQETTKEEIIEPVVITAEPTPVIEEVNEEQKEEIEEENPIVEEVQEEIIQVEPTIEESESIPEEPTKPQVEIEVPQEAKIQVEVIDKPKKEQKVITQKTKKNIRTIEDELYDDILQVKLELYAQMRDPEKQHKAVKAYDILDCMVSKPVTDQEAMNKVISFLTRVDERYSKGPIKGLKLKTNYEKHMK